MSSGNSLCFSLSYATCHMLPTFCYNGCVPCYLDSRRVRYRCALNMGT
ncbi:hypothetical protein V6Z11_A09G196800 [Gossypium hirsutum]